MRRFFITAFSLMIISSAYATELPRLYKGIRPLGMGGAFTAVADDQNALFYNPAGLDKVDGWGLGIVPLQVEVGENGWDFYNDYTDADLEATDEVIQLLRDYSGKYVHYGASSFPYFVMKHVAVGLLGQGNVNIKARPNVLKAEVDAFGTYGFNAGTGWGFLDGQIRVGGAVKFVNAYRLYETYGVADITASDFDERIKDDKKEGSGLGFDLGIMAEAPVLLKPTFGIMIQNLTDTDLGDAGELPQQLNMGLSIGHSVAGFGFNAAADWVDVTNNIGDDDDLPKRLHFGLEGYLPMILSVRAGLYQGYGSFGVTIDLWALKVNYAQYTEEVGSAAGMMPDKRYVVSASLGW